MLRSEAVAIIKRGLGFRQTQDASIVAALQEAQRDMELGQTQPNWLLALEVQLVVDPVLFGSFSDLPIDFNRFHDDFSVFTYADGAGGATKRMFRRMNWDEANAAYGSSELDADEYPVGYVLFGKTRIQWYPTPGQAFTAVLMYYKHDAVLDSDVENEWLKNAPNYLVGLAGAKIASDLRDKGALERFTTMAKMGRGALLGDIVEDELAGRGLIMGRNN